MQWLALATAIFRVMPDLIKFIKNITSDDPAEIPLRTDNAFGKLGRAQTKGQQHDALVNLQSIIRKS